jgi:hypothetical protein
MVTSRVGWAVAVDRNGYPVAVVRTTDGGRVWQGAGPRGMRGQGLRAAFYNARVAWVTGSHPWSRAWPVIFRTTDGGRTWVRMGSVPIGAIGASSPDMVTGQRGFVTGGRLTSGGHVRDVWLYATTDGGATWAAQSASPLLGQATLDFVTPAVGFATSISYGPFRSYLLATADGGATWTPVPARLAASSPARSPTRGQPPTCKTSRLKITMPWSGAAAGTVGGRIGFTNLASRPCRLHGWPVLVAVNAAGESRTAVDKTTTMFGPNLRAAPVVILKPHATAEAVFTGGDHSISGTCPPPYRLLRVTPPGNSEAATIRAWVPYYDNYLPACTPIWVSEVVPFQDLYQPN